MYNIWKEKWEREDDFRIFLDISFLDLG